MKLNKPPRSMFDLSHEKKLSCRMGQLIPIFVSEVLPNDTFRVKTEVMVRFAPLLAPIYHRVNVFVHYFYIPNRLLWKDWEKFITNGRLGTETPPVPPYMDVDTLLQSAQGYLEPGSLADYLGVGTIPDSQTGLWIGNKLNALPFAAYYKAWYDYYRDRNYEADDEILPMESGENLALYVQLRYRKWQHDYFTSALPWTQRGNEVLMPLQGTGTVSYMDESIVVDPATGLPAGPDQGLSVASGFLANQAQTDPFRLENIDEVQIENSSVSINDLRRAVALQQWMERNALAGSRYSESIMAHFARRTSDGRLQRAEYLGGGRTAVKISEVMTTAYSEDSVGTIVPPANMTGRGMGYANQNSFKRNFEEHGFVIGIMSIMPTSAYMQGTHRMFKARNTFLDYPWPSFAHLGEQEVYSYEVYTDRTNMDDEDPTLFGYQSRYADWKHIHSTAHGDFKTTLDYWHLDRKFSASPVLGNNFVTFENELQDRIFAVSDVHTCWCYIHNDVSAVRTLPYYGTPALV